VTAVRNALDNERIGQDVLGALTELRSAYVNRVLKPTVKEYLLGDAGRPHDVSSLYDNVLRLDGLLDAAKFLKSLRQT
jgi:hypothetical protein